MRLHEEELDRVIDFMLTADKLKSTDRTGWVMRRVKNPEHVGDHSFSTALFSYVVARRMGIDAGKCMTMALIHDIAEARIGDIATREKEEDQTVSNAEKQKMESKAMGEILSLLDKDVASEFGALWEELEAGRSEEAKLVKQMDKLDYVLMLVEYSKYMNDGELNEFLATAGSRISIPEVRRIYDRIKRDLAKSRKK
jgi:putative hydrolase of HD superfamily